MAERNLHVVHLLIRDMQDGKVRFLVYPHEIWLMKDGVAYLTMPTKKTMTDPLAPFIRGTSVEQFVEAIVREDLKLAEGDYAIEAEMQPATSDTPSPTTRTPTHYTISPIDVWVTPDQREPLRARLNGQWMTWEEARAHPRVSPTAKAVFDLIGREQEEIASMPPEEATEPKAKPKKRPLPWERLLKRVSDRPSMDALAMRWFSGNKAGVRHLPAGTLDEILDAGNRAFNLRVADPYLRYHMQGVGFTWSFFTDKDKQDIHVHGAPVVEIYGVLQGELEVWWKPFCDRGTSAWNRQVVRAGDWLEVDSLQCHIVHWLGEGKGKGKGVVFKAGPGHLAGIGKIGVEGKTACAECPYSCVKPPEVAELEARISGKAAPQGK